MHQRDDDPTHWKDESPCTPADPVKAARAVLAILNEDKPPAHLVLGSDALRLIRNARTAVDKDIHEWETLSRTTDFPDDAQIASA
jgi:hypothetical protein